ncbi:MAG: HAD-superfamily hydrolase, subfamily variant 3 [Nocardioides sp.]|nr:HAD-superfamily hydrolase, subfamily variant 3 [Nocardioides sp.]
MIRHVLLDADGVLQYVPGGWREALRAYVGDRVDQFVHETTLDEAPCLRGEGDFLPLLAGHLERYGVTRPAAEVYPAIWHDIHVEESSLGLVRDLREVGVGVHLATNQEARRASYMRATLGYDDLFDQSFYSCELGVAKPDAAFFTTAVDRLATTPPEVLFVDDHEPNVVAAREVGLAAEHWTIPDGIPRLHALLEGHGILF